MTTYCQPMLVWTFIFIVKLKIGNSTSLPQSRNEGFVTNQCCYNGGTCYLGSFCHCPKTYSGRYCELHNMNCGSIPHGHWLEYGCDMCLCNNGSYTCLPQALPRQYCREVHNAVYRLDHINEGSAIHSSSISLRATNWLIYPIITVCLTLFTLDCMYNTANTV